MRFKKKLFSKKHSGGSEDMTLNITSMADIFTIILVFLLKSFASGSVTVQPSSDLVLPSALASTQDLTQVNPEDLKVEISAGAILVEGQPAAVLVNYRFADQELDKNGTSRALASIIEKERKRQAAVAELNPDLKQESKVVVLADQKTPYATVKAVLASAAVHGFTDFKLAIIKPGS